MKIPLQFFAEPTDPPIETVPAPAPKKDDETEDMPKWASNFLSEVKTAISGKPEPKPEPAPKPSEHEPTIPHPKDPPQADPKTPEQETKKSLLKRLSDFL